MFEHIDPVGARDRDRTARAPLADNDRDDRHAKAQTAIGRARDGLGLAALLRSDAGIGAGGIDQAHHRKLEAVGHLHQPHGLAIAFGARHAEIVLDAALGV